MRKFICYFIGVLIFVSVVCFTMSGCSDRDAVDVVDAIVEVTHTVTFNTNGGTAVGVIEAKTITQPPMTAKDGYDFGGWYTDYSLTNRATFPMDVKSDIILYAKWILKNESVNYFVF